MMLRDLQMRFLDALISGSTDAACADIVGGNLTPAQRLAFYQNNLIGNQCAALRSIYPVVARLVGDEFFRYSAKAYVTDNASHSGDLNRFGEHLHEFLAAFPPAATLPYLPDTARLEWQVHEVFLAAECEPLRISELADVAPADYPQLCFRLHPAARLFTSRFPIDKIWLFNQDDYCGAASINLDSGPASGVVARDSNYQIVIHPLDAAPWALLHELSQGRTLAQAFDSALHLDSNFDPGPSLQEFVAASFLSGWTTASTSQQKEESSCPN